jgi:hypothetical protein
MRSFKISYTQEINTWLRNNVGRTVTHSQIIGLIGKAHLRDVSIETAVKDFRKTGIFPTNKHAFRKQRSWLLRDSLQHLRLTERGLLVRPARCLYIGTQEKQVQENHEVEQQFFSAVPVQKQVKRYQLEHHNTESTGEKRNECL